MSKNNSPEKKCQDLVAQAMQLIKEAEKIADEAGCTFSFYPAYGMGGQYVPKQLTEEYGADEAGWQSSSHSC